MDQTQQIAGGGPLLQVEGLELDFVKPAGRAKVLKGISFALDRGETLALVGESGSGKSMTALSILKLLPKNAQVRGTIRFAGENLIDLPPGKMRALRGNRIGIVFQEPMSSLNPLFSIGHQVEEAILFHRPMPKSKARARALDLLTLVRLPEPERRFHSYPHELSGGQLQRVMIAVALANDPDMLIADEPTTALDVTIQAQILALMKELQERLGLALLLITHDFGVVRKMADRVCVMNRGEIVETGTAKEIFDHPREAYTRELLAAEPERRRHTAEGNRDIVLDARNVTVDFALRRKFFEAKRAFRAVDGISLTVRKGRTLGIVGESGSGKSTLGRALLGLLRSTGEIYYEGQDIGGLKPEAMRMLRQRLQIVFQDPFGSLSPRLKVSEIIGEGLLIHRPEMSRQERDRLIAEVLRDVGIDPETRFRFPHEFSGGQRQRIAIARAMVLRPNVIVLDEPTSALDRSVQLQIIRLLEDLQEKYGLTYIFISHDLSVIRAISDDVIVMKSGRVVESGNVEKIFSAPENPYTRELMKASFEIVT